ncbi:MAG: hypothetical protein QOJ09_2464 [Actinomycetota bacterium]|nr:hypothetical protein [Actinomycetota bacterium]
MPITAATFSAVARLLADEARRRGLAAPGFRSPPRLPDAARTIRRQGASSVVAVRRAGRSADDVIADMVEGVLVANRVSGAEADRWRAELAASATLD